MQMRDRKLAVSLSLLVLLLGATAVYLLSSLTFFSNDIGLRFLQIRTLIESGWQTFAVPYPARFLDPELAHIPYYYAYLLLDGQLYLNISPYLPLITSFLFKHFGPTALPTLPVLAGVTTALATYKLGKFTRVRYPHLLLWFTVLATPILFYSLTLWDHTLGTVGAVVATAAVSYGLHAGRRRWYFWGGLAVALGAAQRVEIHVFALALMASLLLVSWRNWMQWGAFVLGGMAGTAVIWALQTVWFGHPLGVVFASHVFGYGVPAAYPVEPYSSVTITRPIEISRLLLYIEAADPVIFVAAMAVLTGAFLLVLTLRVSQWRKRGFAKGLLVIVLGGYAVFAAVAWQRELPGLITTFPPLALSLAFVSRDDDAEPGHLSYQFVYLTAVLFLAVMVLLWPSYGGSQWGARYLLPAYPLLLYLAFYTYSRWQTTDRELFGPTLRTIFASLLLVSVFLQLLSVRLLLQQHAEQITTKEAITSLPTDLILTNHPFLPSFMSALEEKSFLYVESEEDLRHLLPRFQDHGIERFALVTVEGMPLTIPAVEGVNVRAVAPLIYEIE